MVSCYLGLGSNLGASAGVLREALEQLAAGAELVGVSSFWLSRPWGVTDQPDFVNAVACVRSGRHPQDLLAWFHELEEAFGRRRIRHWGPRILDVDLLTWGEGRYRGWELEVPHPGLMERAFVLAPLLELAPDFRHPVTGLRARDAWDALPEKDRSELRRLVRGYRP